MLVCFHRPAGTAASYHISIKEAAWGSADLVKSEDLLRNG